MQEFIHCLLSLLQWGIKHTVFYKFCDVTHAKKKLYHVQIRETCGTLDVKMSLLKINHVTLIRRSQEGGLLMKVLHRFCSGRPRGMSKPRVTCPVGSSYGVAPTGCRPCGRTCCAQTTSPLPSHVQHPVTRCTAVPLPFTVQAAINQRAPAPLAPKVHHSITHQAHVTDLPGVRATTALLCTSCDARIAHDLEQKKTQQPIEPQAQCRGVGRRGKSGARHLGRRNVAWWVVQPCSTKGGGLGHRRLGLGTVSS